MIARKIETLYIRAPDAEDPRGPPGTALVARRETFRKEIFRKK